MLGSSLVRTVKGLGCEVSAYDVQVQDAIGIDFLDVRDREAVRKAVRSTKPDIIYHLAALTDLEYCESNPDEAFRTNAVGTQNVALAAEEVGAALVYVSTAGVFDGDKDGGYTEFDRPNPINVYGLSKLQGELIVAELTNQHFIVRAGWMIGGGPKKDRKFVGRILRQIKSGQKEISCVTDKLGTPTYAPYFSEALVNLVSRRDFGLYHLVCNGKASRYEVAQEILNIIGRDDIKLRAVDSSYFIKEFPTPRPRCEMLLNYMLELKGMNTIRTWQQGLHEYLNAYEWGVRHA